MDPCPSRLVYPRVVTSEADDEGVALPTIETRAHCEYCLLPTEPARFERVYIVQPDEWARYVGHSLGSDSRWKVIGSPDQQLNRAWACWHCSSMLALNGGVGNLADPLFHPRLDRWTTHFQFVLEFRFIVGRTRVGRLTQEVLKFNGLLPGGPVRARSMARQLGQYPPL
jgi:hypothetical protein